MVKHECDKCKLGKQRIATILRSNPNYQNVKTDDENVNKKGRLVPMFPAQEVGFLVKDYYPDVYAEKITGTISGLLWFTQQVIIEVDHIQEGSSSHRSDTSTKKDKTRDKHFLSKKIPTVRFDLRNIVGRKAMLDHEILQGIEMEIEYQLKTK